MFGKNFFWTVQFSGLFSDSPKQLQSKFRLMQSITDQFWKNWSRTYFPTLLIQQKWHTSKRNVRKGDICLLRDHTGYRSEWRLARVTEVYADRRGAVRNVGIVVIPKQDASLLYRPGTGQKLQRHVSCLIVLVPIEDQNGEIESPKASCS